MRKGSNFSAIMLFLAAVTLPVGAQSFCGRMSGAIADPVIRSGEWKAVGIALASSIAPADYPTNWFRVLCAAVVVVLIWVLYRARIQQMRRQERTLRDVIETMPTFAWTALPDGSPDFTNRHWGDYSAAAGDKIAGLGWQETLHPEDAKTHAERWRASVATGQPFENEVRIRRAGGGYRWSLVRAESMRDAKGRILKWYGTTTDIEDRKRAEQACEEIEEQWRAAFESNPTMYFIIDEAGNIATVNTFGAEQLGYQVEDLIGRPVLDVFYEPDKEAVQKHAHDCLKQPSQTARWEARKVRKDGTVLWVRETARAGSLKKRPVLLVVCEDITEQKRAEEAAGRSSSELRALIENVPAMVFIALTGPSNEFVSRGWREYTGLSEKDTAGSGWQNAVHPEDLEEHMKKWQACSATGEPYESETRFRRAVDGTYRWFLVRAVPLQDETGAILRWYGVLTDIEDRKRAEALIAGEKRILELVAKGNPLPEILDSLCRLVEEQASGALASVLLVERDRLKHGGAPSLPRAYTEAIDGVLIGPSVGSCGTAAYCGQQVIVENIATDPLWTEYRDAALPHSLNACWSTPIFSPERAVIGTFAMYYREPRSPSPRDQQIIEQITHLAGVAIQRKLTEHKLQRSETYLAEAQRLAHTGSWAYGAAGGPAYWSEENLRIWGFDPQQGVPDIELVRTRIHPEDRDKAAQFAMQEVRAKRDFIQDFRIALPDGTVRHIHAVGHPVVAANGEAVEVVGTHLDVTERKHAEDEREKLRRLEDELAHINRVSMMGELAASLSHELKQPIAAAITDADTCLRWLDRDSPDIKEAREAAGRIVQDCNRAAAIIDHVRSLSQKDVLPERELVDLDEIACEVLVLLRSEADRYSIPMRTNFAAGHPRVAADRVQMQQVFLNLMLNGIEAMKDSGGELIIMSRLAGDGEVLVSVLDTGIGLPAGKEDKLFDPFFTTKPQGSGMGLAICRSIIESHGGKLWAKPNSDGGTVFNFTLPIAIEVEP